MYWLLLRTTYQFNIVQVDFNYNKKLKTNLQLDQKSV